MYRARLASWTACLILGACVSDQPQMPGRGLLHGSTWISGGTSTSFSTADGPVEIVNMGSSELRIGTGPNAIVLRPGEAYLTSGLETEIFNPSQGRVRVELRETSAAPVRPDASLPTTIGVVPVQQGIDD